MASEIYYDDVDLGDELPSMERQVSDYEVVEFLNIARIGEAKENRFTSAEAAKSEGLPEAIVPGAMNIAIMSTLITSWSPTVTLRKLDVVFRGMVLHNRPINLTGLITDKDIVDGSPQLECDVVMETVGRRSVRPEAGGQAGLHQSRARALEESWTVLSTM